MVHAKKLAWCVLVVSLACSSAPTAGEDACRDGEKIRSYLLETADYIEVCVQGKRIIKGFVERVREDTILIRTADDKILPSLDSGDAEPIRGEHTGAGGVACSEILTQRAFYEISPGGDGRGRHHDCPRLPPRALLARTAEAGTASADSERSGGQPGLRPGGTR